METKVFVVAFALGVALLGCSPCTSSPTEPTNLSAAQQMARQQDVLVDVNNANKTPNTIHVDENLFDPLNKFDIIEVSADMTFNIEQLPILSKNEVRLQLELNGQATPSPYHGPFNWPLNGKSSQTVDLGVRDTKRIEHSYAIHGSQERLRLHVLYRVTEQSLSIDRMWLTARVDKTPIDQ